MNPLNEEIRILNFLIANTDKEKNTKVYNQLNSLLNEKLQQIGS